VRIIKRISKKIGECFDIKNSVNGRAIFHVVLVYTVRFLISRLENVRYGANSPSYLMERSDGSLPREVELQNDYHGFMMSNISGVDIEVSNVGGGRADLVFSLGGERIVVEVKRDDKCCSFENLIQSYALQATEYQNVGIRVGFLLVLDLSKTRKGGTPHISELISPFPVPREGESHPRWLVVVKVPGRRVRPSDLTREARSTNPG
jgi:hypothetical protein